MPTACIKLCRGDIHATVGAMRIYKNNIGKTRSLNYFRDCPVTCRARRRNTLNWKSAGKEDNLNELMFRYFLDRYYSSGRFIHLSLIKG